MSCKLITAFPGAFLLCWTPYALVSMWSAFGNPGDISPLAGTIPALIAKSSVVWNPLIYVLTNKQFRTRVGSLFHIHERNQVSEASQEGRVEMDFLHRNQKTTDNIQDCGGVIRYQGTPDYSSVKSLANTSEKT